MRATETIHVYLRDEGVDCRRPVEAVNEGENRYRITSVNRHPDDEQWEFTTGELVVCGRRRLSGADALVAIRRAIEAQERS
jgi:hypothetical protein